MRMQVFERGSTYSENSYWKDILKYFFLNIFIYWFEKERGVEEGGKEGKRGKERERERDMLFHLLMQSSVASCMCPNGRSNPQP